MLCSCHSACNCLDNAGPAPALRHDSVVLAFACEESLKRDKHSTPVLDFMVQIAHHPQFKVVHWPMRMCSVAALNTRRHGAPGSISSSAVSSTSLYSRYRNTLGSVCSVAVLMLHTYIGLVERMLSEELGGERAERGA